MPCLKYNEPSNVACELDTQIGLFILLNSYSTFQTTPSHPSFTSHTPDFQIRICVVLCFVLSCRSVPFNSVTHITQNLGWKYIYMFIETNCFLSQKFRHLKCRDISKSVLMRVLTQALIRGVFWLWESDTWLKICRCDIHYEYWIQCKRCHHFNMTQKLKIK